ncbi:TetR/AcrR family transcriptional regulator [Streptomyces sp. NBC_01456]|uniref:TetR/AcrR family transcriptional regulator n=1 Tax=unclassified Streptomyces TaxID=2593676 RepID=UPI002E316A43|nr:MULTISPECIES: helix-turn-helix domain-containing protein [unclassified Streptomyces]
MAERKARADALRNREAVLTAADELFARSASPRSVSMDDIAAAAGVGKGTLFRRFGDRTGLIRAVFEARIEPLRHAVEEGPAPLGPSAAPRDRVPALLDALLRFKLDHRHLSLALEEAGSGSPYEGASYAWWHGVLRETLERLPDVVDGAADAEGGGEGGGESDGAEKGAGGGAVAGRAEDCDFMAHALLAATRADLVEYLAGQGGLTPARMRARLAAYVSRVLGGGALGGGRAA